MNDLKITLKDKQKIIVENVKEIKTNLSGYVIVIDKNRAVTMLPIKNIVKYELVTKGE